MNISTLAISSLLFFPGIHQATEVDQNAIKTLLSSYTESVAKGDQKRFESLLLRLDIPFTGLKNLSKYETNGDEVDTRNYSAFKASIFESGIVFKQTFYNQKIEQDGNLAQVSLDFVTTNTSSGAQTYGWKVLHLLKVRGAWKIASELYTGRPLNGGK